MTEQQPAPLGQEWPPLRQDVLYEPIPPEEAISLVPLEAGVEHHVRLLAAQGRDLGPSDGCDLLREIDRLRAAMAEAEERIASRKRKAEALRDALEWFAYFDTRNTSIAELNQQRAAAQGVLGRYENGTLGDDDV